MSSPVVKLDDGQLLGKVCQLTNGKQFFTFKGIPYAKPPLEDLRFAPPVDPEPWEGIRDATKDCSFCAQLDRGSLQVIGDEDCLYLNVYTPSLPSSDTTPLPVMVFIHGGGFVFGSGTDDALHGPDYLLEKDVVVVSFNYRLGILGFLSLDCKEVPGNMGLKDQVQVLKWVQKNITNFNGNPDNVTIFGISAGGASVEYLLMSPTTEGLFHKAIAQSGSSLLPWAHNNEIRTLALKIPFLKNKIIIDTIELVKFLKDMSLKDLVTCSMLALSTDKWRGGVHFGYVPTVEKQGDWKPFITKSPFEMLKKGEFQKVPFISGFCNREGLLMYSEPYTVIIDRLIREKNFLNHLPFEVDDTKKDEVETKLKTVYLEGEKEFDEEDSFAIDFFGDVDFISGVFVATYEMSKKNPNVYMYEFAYDGELNYLKKKLRIERKGACHGDDGGYLIKTAILNGNLSDSDKLVRDKMCQMWTDFARNGRPTTTAENENIVWEPIAETGLAYLHIDDKFTMKYDFTQRMKLFTEIYEKYYKQ